MQCIWHFCALDTVKTRARVGATVGTTNRSTSFKGMAQE